ncbi:MAG: hypothetical protein ABEK84_03040 [Salinibacter sp.]
MTRPSLGWLAAVALFFLLFPRVEAARSSTAYAARVPYTFSVSPKEQGFTSGVYFHRLVVEGTLGTGDRNHIRFDASRKMAVVQ